MRTLQSLEQRTELCHVVGAPPSEGGLGLVTHLFDQCLFALPRRLNSSSTTASSSSSSTGDAPLEAVDDDAGPHPPKCKNPESRHTAYQLLTKLAQCSPACLACAVALAAPHHSLGLTAEQRERSAQKDARRRSRKQSGSAAAAAAAVAAAMTGGQQQQQLARPSSFIGSSTSMRQASGYCGLRNLGCICYMNSTLQQVVHNVWFCVSLLHLPSATMYTLYWLDSLYLRCCCYLMSCTRSSSWCLRSGVQCWPLMARLIYR
jgi:hypothetical protein